MTLYHGTSDDNYAAIQQSNMLRGPVFLTPNWESAEQYSDGGQIIEIDIDEEDLLIDFDLPGQALLDVETANDYSGNDGWTIFDYLNAGQSVATRLSVEI